MNGDLQVLGQRAEGRGRPHPGPQEVDQDFDRLDVPHFFEVQQVVTDNRIDMRPPPTLGCRLVLLQVRLGESAKLEQIIQGLLGSFPQDGANLLDRQGMQAKSEKAARE